jgi:hypothetical protein
MDKKFMFYFPEVWVKPINPITGTGTISGTELKKMKQ